VRIIINYQNSILTIDTDGVKYEGTINSELIGREYPFLVTSHSLLSTGKEDFIQQVNIINNPLKTSVNTIDSNNKKDVSSTIKSHTNSLKKETKKNNYIQKTLILLF
jgi:hypothetical protein